MIDFKVTNMTPAVAQGVYNALGAQAHGLEHQLRFGSKVDKAGLQRDLDHIKQNMARLGAAMLSAGKVAS